jgi:hypothetical protein|tara:strand:+ start:213 stop:860 length:648 start_codon:yes stop_codon:yes gene_type:complete
MVYIIFYDKTIKYYLYVIYTSMASASTHNYTFYNLTGINDDVVGLSEVDAQNQQFGSYTTQNFFEKHCGMKQPISFATKQPNVFYNGGAGVVGVNGCNVESDSDLRIGTIQTNPKCRINLQERPFKTVPFLGRGKSDSIKESKLQQGTYFADKKSCRQITEKSFRTTDVDLVPSLKATIQNPNNLVEGVANKGWIRGGLPSRDMSRDNDYFKQRK